MKKVISFIASPRKNGNTDTIVQKLIEGLNSSELVTEIVYLSDYRIYSCNGCLSCSGTGKCVIEDDMNLLYPKIEEADGYIFASPTYN